MQAIPSHKLSSPGGFCLKLLLCLLWAQPALAQQGSQMDVTVEGEPEDARAPSAWRSRLDLERLQRTGGDLAEGVGAQAGVYARRLGADGARAELTVRGGSSQQVLVLLDGVPLNAARGGGVDLSLLPPSLLQSAVVHRGGSAARFGAGALGGALSLRSRLPRRGLVASATTGAGSFGTWRAGGALSGGGQELRGLLALEGLWTQGDFPFEDDQGGERVRVNADAQRLSGLNTLVWEPAPRWQLRLTSLLSQVDRGVPGVAEFQDVLSQARGQERRAVLAAQARRAELVDLPGALVDLELHASWSGQDNQYRNPQRLLRGDLPFESQLLDQSLQSGALASAYLGSLLGHVGVQLRSEGLRRRELVQPDRFAVDRFWRSGASLFADAEYLLWEERVSLLAALRLQWVEGFGWTPSPSVGVRAQASGSLTLMGNLARAWRPPGFDELYLKQEFLEGDPSLRPEDALSADLGLRWQPAPWLRAELVGFWLEIDDLILFLPVSQTLFRAQNTGAVTSRGAELSLELRPAPWCSLQGAGTWTDASLQAPPQDPLPGRPALEGQLRASLHGPRWEVFAGVRGRSALYLDNFGNLSDPAALFVDAGVVARPWKQLQLSLVGRNVLDERGAVDSLQQPLPGASLYAQLSWSLEPEPQEEEP